MLRSARDRSPVKETNAHQLIDLIALSAWKSAEPGLIFFDQINKYNVFAKARGAPLRATNPCGEQKPVSVRIMQSWLHQPCQIL